MKVPVFVSLAVLLVVFGVFFSPASARASAARSDGVRILQSDSQGITIELEVPAYVVETVELDGQIYQRIFIEGYGLSDNPGEPELPQKGLLLGVPPWCPTRFDGIGRGEYRR